MQTSRPINAFGLLFSILWARLRGNRDAHDKLPMEALDPATAGIGVILAVSTVISLGLTAAVVVSGVNAILHTT